MELETERKWVFHVWIEEGENILYSFAIETNKRFSSSIRFASLRFWRCLFDYSVGSCLVSSIQWRVPCFRVPEKPVPKRRDPMQQKQIYIEQISICVRGCAMSRWCVVLRACQFPTCRQTCVRDTRGAETALVCREGRFAMGDWLFCLEAGN